MSETQRPEAPKLQDFQDRAARNPFAGELATVAPIGAIANAEQQRAVAEVQARMIIARSNPRDQQRCMDAILRDCTRPALAEGALYQYSRGGSAISGPSIRLAESIARRWGNIASGIKELSRTGGYSECVAYAWDLETGYYDERQYQVKHWRDTKAGGHPIVDEREIYELVANLGQRRKRAVLLTVIPGDVVEAAVQQCEDTLKASADTSPEALKRMAEAFLSLGVTQAMIEKRCQCRLEAIRPAQVVQLRKIYASINDEMSAPKDWFETTAWTDVAAGPQRPGVAPAGAAQPQTAQETPAAPRRGRPPKQQAETPPPAEDEPAADRFPDEQHAAEDQPSNASAAAEGGRLNAPSVAGQEFESWLLDEFGDLIGERPVDNPVFFARQLENRWEKSDDKATLLEQNANGIAAARAASPEADAILADLYEPEQVETPAAPAIMLQTVRGKPDEKTYLKGMKDALANADQGALMDLLADQHAAIVTLSAATRPLVAKAFMERWKVLGGVGVPVGLSNLMAPSKAAEPAPQVDPAAQQLAQDERSVDARCADLMGCKNINELEAMGRGTIITALSNRLRGEGKDELRQKMLNAYSVRKAELTNGGNNG